MLTVELEVQWTVGSSTKSAMDRLQEAVDMVKATRERELATGKGAGSCGRE